MDSQEKVLCGRIDQLMARVERLEMAVDPSKTQPCDGTTAAVYVEQIKILTQDFLKEREDRERMAGKVDSLQMMLKHAEERYRTLYHQALALQNGAGGGATTMTTTTTRRRYAAPLFACDGVDDGVDVTENQQEDDTMAPR